MIWSFFPPSCKKMNPETATCTTNATGWQPAFNRKKPLMAQAFQAGPHAKMCMLWFNTDLPTWFLLSFTPPGEEYIFGLGRVRQFRVGISCPDWHNTFVTFLSVDILRWIRWMQTFSTSCIRHSWLPSCESVPCQDEGLEIAFHKRPGTIWDNRRGVKIGRTFFAALWLTKPLENWALWLRCHVVVRQQSEPPPRQVDLKVGSRVFVLVIH